MPETEPSKTTVFCMPASLWVCPAPGCVLGERRRDARHEKCHITSGQVKTRQGSGLDECELSEDRSQIQASGFKNRLAKKTNQRSFRHGNHFIMQFYKCMSYLIIDCLVIISMWGTVRRFIISLKLQTHTCIYYIF